MTNQQISTPGSRNQETCTCYSLAREANKLPAGRPPEETVLSEVFLEEAVQALKTCLLPLSGHLRDIYCQSLERCCSSFKAY